jgi:importin-8
VKITGGASQKCGKALTSKKANIRINKCWNTIRFIAEHDYFAEHFLSVIEETLMPLFEYIVQPNSIDFDDDIIFCICSLLKKSKKASPVLRKIFPYLPKF